MDILNFILAPIPTRFPAIILKIKMRVSRPEGIVGNARGAELFQQKASKNNNRQNVPYCACHILAQINIRTQKKI